MTIMRAQIEFEDPAWSKYDEAYRDKAASTGNRKWSTIDPHHYNQPFTGRVKMISLCSLCRNAGHSAATCQRKCPYTYGEVNRGGGESGKRRFRAGNFCWDYNDGVPCQYQSACKYKYKCPECGDDHPEIHCPNKKKGGKMGGKRVSQDLWWEPMEAQASQPQRAMEK